MKNYQGGLIERLLSLMIDGGNIPNETENAVANQIKEFIDKIPGGLLIYSADNEEKILYANKALLSIFKCKTYHEFQALTGNSFRGVVHPDDLEQVETSIAEQIKQNDDNMDYVEYRIVCKDGTVRRVEDYGHFTHTEWGDVYYVFITDATEKINSRLQERLQRLEIIEGLSVNYDSILYFDLINDTILPYRLSSRMKEQFNEKWEVRKYNELIKEYISRWVYPDDRASVSESLSPEYMCRVLTDAPTYHLNYRCVQNGEIIHLQLRIVNVGEKNTANKFVLGFRRVDEEILQEINQKQLLEEALKAAKLADVAKNTFLSNMSHDMRTPLNAIFGSSTLIKKNLADAETVKHYLERIEEAGKQILELTAKVLEVSYIETQDFIVNKTPCNLIEIVNDVYHTTLAQASKSDLLVTLNTDEIAHRNVIADGDKLKNILLSLTNNAVKYNKKGGKIQITVTEQSHEDGLHTYRFAVTDTGVGIDSDAFERIFDPFERERDTLESGVSGAGLGLTIAKHYAEKLGGNICVESVKGAGSTFTFTLNLKLTESDVSSEEKDKSVNLKGLKLLLVEDNEINQEIETDILQDAGFEVELAENGKIALDKIKNFHEDTFDAVLMDIQMPVMDGRQAAAAIRALGGRRAQLPIIALSANAFERDIRLSKEHGMDAHLTKPMDLDIIIHTLAEILSRGK